MYTNGIRELDSFPNSPQKEEKKLNFGVFGFNMAKGISQGAKVDEPS